MRYHLELTGFVGYEGFNSRKTDALLKQYPGKPVDVLIDSTGGSLAHGLSIAAAFRNHGDVTAHLRGMCASASTIAAMGAKKICIEPDAFFLVHKVMISFFDWSVHNADSLQQYIEALTAQKKDLETLDSSVAATYANRCKKPVKDLLDLMKEGKWLTASQALDWGFVDEVKELAGSQSPKLTKAVADAFAAQGLPIPPLEIEPESEQHSFFSELKNLFKSHFSMNPEKSTGSEAQVAPATAPENAAQALPEASAQEQELKAEIDTLKKEKAELQAKLDALNKQPGDSTSQAVDSPAPKNQQEENHDEFSQFFKANSKAAEIFNALP